MTTTATSKTSSEGNRTRPGPSVVPRGVRFCLWLCNLWTPSGHALSILIIGPAVVAACGPRDKAMQSHEAPQRRIKGDAHSSRFLPQSRTPSFVCRNSDSRTTNGETNFETVCIICFYVVIYILILRHYQRFCDLDHRFFAAICRPE